jgi:hypothetical protein
MAIRTEKEAAAKLKLKQKTLANQRWAGTGPRFIKYPSGAIRYDDIELDAYQARNTYRSTTEAQAARRAAAKR